MDKCCFIVKMLNGFCNISHNKNEIASNVITCKGIYNAKIQISHQSLPYLWKLHTISRQDSSRALIDLLLSDNLNIIFVKKPYLPCMIQLSMR